MAVFKGIRLVPRVSLQWEFWRQQMLSGEVRAEHLRAISLSFTFDD